MSETVQEVVQNLLQKIGITDAKLTVEKNEANKILRVEIETADSSLLIGWRGETINALQHLTKALLRNKELINDYFLVLDVDDYKKRQQENILSLSEKKAETVRASGISQFLPPMSPFFRKVVHMHFTQPKFADITTESIGEGENRQIKILKVEN